MSASAGSPPQRLGRYEVGVKVGGGGMANVYVGRGVSDDGTEELVALKVIRDEYGNDPRFLRMFSDEARILERISHPHVIRTLEYGIERNHRYIVMELLSGRTLHEAWELLCERGQRLSFTLGAWICARVAEGLHFAHELTDASGLPLGIVHRDVNPTNIFLTHAGEVKLIDFGLAKARMRRHQTQGGMVKGKIPYLAPEQLELRAVDRRVDVFGLGTTLWEMGTAKRLFKRATDLETLTAVRDQVVPDPRTLVPEYPEALARIVTNALRKDPDERYATANAFRMDLDAFVARSDFDMKRELGSFMAKLFPGEWSAHATWLDEAIAVPLATVAPPPMPVPVASSKLLDPEVEVGEAEISIPGIRVPDFE